MDQPRLNFYNFYKLYKKNSNLIYFSNYSYCFSNLKDLDFVVDKMIFLTKKKQKQFVFKKVNKNKFKSVKTLKQNCLNTLIFF